MGLLVRTKLRTVSHGGDSLSAALTRSAQTKCIGLYSCSHDAFVYSGSHRSTCGEPTVVCRRIPRAFTTSSPRITSQLHQNTAHSPWYSTNHIEEKQIVYNSSCLKSYAMLQDDQGGVVSAIHTMTRKCPYSELSVSNLQRNQAQERSGYNNAFLRYERSSCLQT